MRNFMTRTEELDFLIKYLYENCVDNKSISPIEINHSSEMEIPEIEDALFQMKKMGFVDGGISLANDGAYLNFEGRVFYENTYLWFKGQPFKQKRKLELLKTTWTITKTVALVINGMTLLVIAWLTFKTTMDTNKMNYDIELLKSDLLNEKQKVVKLTDSLKVLNTKIINDTIK